MNTPAGALVDKPSCPACGWEGDFDLVAQRRTHGGVAVVTLGSRCSRCKHIEQVGDAFLAGSLTNDELRALAHAKAEELMREKGKPS